MRRRVPCLSKLHVPARLTWCQERVEWTQDQWDRISFSDESKFNLYGSDGRRYCRRDVGEEYLPQNVDERVKHGGGSVMVWGCITARGTGRLHRIVGNLNAAGLCDIYQESLLGTFDDYWMTINNVIFQEDNDSKHTSRLAREWRATNDVTRLNWPANSPDLNPIENTWNEVDCRMRMRSRQPHTLDELWLALPEEWKSLDFRYIRNLYTSMNRCVTAVAENKGLWTRY